MKKILVVDPMHESLGQMLEQIGWGMDYHPEITREEIKQRHIGYDGLIVRSKTTIDHDLLGDNITLKFVGRAGAGLDNVDMDFLQKRKVHVLHAAEGNRDAVGEFTLGLLLSLLRNIPKADQEVKHFKWEREANRGEEIYGKTIAIIGYGNMGSAFAEKLTGFGCKVLAYDRYKTGFSNFVCEEVQMERIFEETDILSLHVPLTRETKGLINNEFISRFKKNIVLINTARGEIVRLEDVVQNIRTGKIRGLALDVLENEKLDKLTPEQKESLSFLKSKSNVIFTPHIAGWTFESHVKINAVLTEKIKKLDL